MIGHWWYEGAHDRNVRVTDTIDLSDVIVVGDLPAWIDWLETGRRVHDLAHAARKKANRARPCRVLHH